MTGSISWISSARARTLGLPLPRYPRDRCVDFLPFDWLLQAAPFKKLAHWRVQVLCFRFICRLFSWILKMCMLSSHVVRAIQGVLKYFVTAQCTPIRKMYPLTILERQGVLSVKPRTYQNDPAWWFIGSILLDFSVSLCLSLLSKHAVKDGTRVCRAQRAASSEKTVIRWRWSGRSKWNLLHWQKKYPVDDIEKAVSRKCGKVLNFWYMYIDSCLYL